MPKRAAGPEWAEGKYVKVFRTLSADRPDLWADDATLAWWLRLLIHADESWPGSAAIPRGLPDVVEARLVEAEVIDLMPGGYYRFHGLHRLRGSGVSFAVVGGLARAQKARRDESGRMLPASPLDQQNPTDTQPAGPENGSHPAGSPAGPSPLDQPAGQPNGTAPSSRVEPSPLGVQPTSALADQPAGTQPSSDYTTLDVRPLTSTSSVGFVSPAGAGAPEPAPAPTPAPARAREAGPVRGSRDTAGWIEPSDCDDPAGHGARWLPVPDLDRWRCPVCEARKRTGPSFRERAGWTPGDAPF